ncbi:flagellar biosynthetic protein FliO [Pseudomonas sp. LS44]|uniref:flagellar biosynthetic protein FliO n=1 Tax=Pseudomonas sp. LS44 TaxID=1357074 RepID=UPI00215A471F|nr:flagellar biosynthetic protein FliO [Pseudomonas sp. LS44]UVE16364.1 flagellar biosynthetic protein FliO [Pseudomonas sp. LS44]
MRAVFLAAVLGGLPLLAQAAEPAAAPVVSSGIGGQLVQLLLGLLLVIGLIFLLAWLMRRVQQMAPRGGQIIKIVATQALGPRDRLVLVEVGSEQVLLGLSAGRITPLHVLAEPVVSAAGEPASADFALQLAKLLGREQKGKP